MLKPVMQFSGQILFYALFAVFIGYFSVAPAYTHFPADQALIKASFSHAGQPVEECRVRTAAELEKLPPNMRAPTVCGRERSPVMFELELDGKRLYRAEHRPSGLSRDGASTINQRFAVPAGRHHLRARLSDNVRNPETTYTREQDVTIAAGRVFVVDFNIRSGGFFFK